MSSERVVITNKVELQKALAAKTDEIIVEGNFGGMVLEIKKGQLSDTERMGVDLGSGGSLSLLEYGLNSLISVFDPTPKEDKKIRRQITELYTIHKWTNDSFLLRLKQLDY